MLEAVRSDEIEMIACERLFGEVEAALASPYFRERVSPEERAAILPMLRALATVVPDPVAPPRIVRDPNDDYLVALGQVTGAEVIVTGDRDLLDHEGLEPPAITAREVCRRLGLR